MAETVFAAIDKEAALIALNSERRAVCRGRPTQEVLARYDFAMLTLQELPSVNVVPLSDYLQLQERVKELEGALMCGEAAESK